MLYHCTSVQRLAWLRSQSPCTHYSELLQSLWRRAETQLSHATDTCVSWVQFPSKNLQEAGIHGHFFVNGGNLSLLSGGGRSIKQAVTEDFLRKWRWTVVSLVMI